METVATEVNEISATPASQRIVVTALGLGQILAWGSSYYLLAVLAQPISTGTGWSLAWIVGGISLGLLIAGLVSPFVGRRIHVLGGRPVLATSAVLLSIGLLTLSVSPNIAVYLLAWSVIGLGMGAGLYDAAFSTLGRLYGHKARQAITALTLFGGFASTVCWPLSAFLASELGWRGACVAYAAIHLVFVLPLYLFALPRTPDSARQSAPPPHAAPTAHPEAKQPRTAVFALLAVTVTIGAVISTVISIHLLTILQARDIALAAAVALGALVGPSQVGARFIETLIGRFHHPIWTHLASTVGVAIGMGALWAGFQVVAAALVFYGAGIGLESIARATLPLSLFGPSNYAPIMGKLAMPSLIAQAAAPSIGAVLLNSIGASGTLGVLVIVAGINVILVVTLMIRTRKSAN